MSGTVAASVVRFRYHNILPVLSARMVVPACACARGAAELGGEGEAGLCANLPICYYFAAMRCLVLT
eukprot:817214-Rhodomonas_salina.2